MARTITCKDCGTYLGEIRDAKLSKKIVYKCSDCESWHKVSRGFDDHKAMDKYWKLVKTVRKLSL